MEAINWEVVTGCERLTPGCDNCPTYWNHKKLGLDYHPQTHPELLEDPIHNLEPAVYLVAAGSDLFHEAVRLEFIKKVFYVMQVANWHHFEVGSKRIERMAVLSSRYLTWGENMLAFTGVESAEYRWRIDELRKIEARRMVSFGPMTGRVGEVNLEGIEVAGAVVEDYGPKPRPIPDEWVEHLRIQAEAQNVRWSTTRWQAKEIDHVTA